MQVVVAGYRPRSASLDAEYEAPRGHSLLTGDGGMLFKTGDIVTLKGSRTQRWVVLATYPSYGPPGAEAMIEPVGEAWNRSHKLVPTADLSLLPVDLEDMNERPPVGRIRGKGSSLPVTGC